MLSPGWLGLVPKLMATPALVTLLRLRLELDAIVVRWPSVNLTKQAAPKGMKDLVLSELNVGFFL